MTSAEKVAQEEALEARLTAIHKRVQWIADAEARAAWVKGVAATGIHEPERDRLLDEADEILEKLEKLQNA